MGEDGPQPPADHAGVSRFLSYVLRHAPESIGVTMDGGGWVEIDELIEKAAPQQVLGRSLLEQVVADSAKQRFAISEDGNRIRANQGHSIDVELGLTPTTPPSTLYHGTAERFLDAINADGLLPGDRQHVHLSPDRATATAVGRRHGKPVVLTVDSGAMHRAGSRFYRSENGVWLTDSVPARWLTVDA